eukprot:358763-Chlamydomonas_euryale.AAC.2
MHSNANSCKQRCMIHACHSTSCRTLAGSVVPILCHEILKACPDKTPPPTWIEEELPATDAAEAIADADAQGGDDYAHDSKKQEL